MPQTIHTPYQQSRSRKQDQQGSGLRLTVKGQTRCEMARLCAWEESTQRGGHIDHTASICLARTAPYHGLDGGRAGGFAADIQPNRGERITFFLHRGVDDLLFHHVVRPISIFLAESEPKRGLGDCRPRLASLLGHSSFHEAQRTHLWHPKPISHLCAEGDLVETVRVHVPEEAQVDDETLVDVGRHLAVAEGVAVDLRVPGVLLGEGSVDVGVQVVKGERQRVIRVVLLVLLHGISDRVVVSFVEFPWLVADPLHILLLQDNLTECHGLLCQVSPL